MVWCGPAGRLRRRRWEERSACRPTDRVDLLLFRRDLSTIDPIIYLLIIIGRLHSAFVLDVL